jgi:ribosomal protein L29
MPRMTTEEFFREFGALPIKFADTVYVTHAAPTISEMLEHFVKMAVLAENDVFIKLVEKIKELEAEIAELRAAKKSGGKAADVEPLLNRLKALEEEVAKLRAAKAEAPIVAENSDLKTGVALQAQDKLEHPNTQAASDPPADSGGSESINTAAPE